MPPPWGVASSRCSVSDGQTMPWLIGLRGQTPVLVGIADAQASSPAPGSAFLVEGWGVRLEQLPPRVWPTKALGAGLPVALVVER